MHKPRVLAGTEGKNTGSLQRDLSVVIRLQDACQRFQSLRSGVVFGAQDHGLAVLNSEGHEGEHAVCVDGLIEGLANAGDGYFYVQISCGFGEEGGRTGVQSRGAGNDGGTFNHEVLQFFVFDNRGEPV